MASREFEELQAKLREAPAPPEGESLTQLRARIDASLGALPLADGVSVESVDAAGVPALSLAGANAGAAPWLVYFHGGGYRIGSALAWRAYASQLAAAVSANVLLVDYRLAPEAPFPAAVDDALAAFRWLVSEGRDPRCIVLAGDSAGGGLALAALVALRDAGDPRPAAGVLLSPWADLTNRAATFETNAASDRLFSRDQAMAAASLYLQGHEATDPLASPVFANFEGLPPLLVHASKDEVLLDDARTIIARAEQARVDVASSIVPEMPHVWHMSVPAFPEAVVAVDEIANFVARTTKL